MGKINTDESQNVEFKESWRDEYLKWICGFANAQGGKLYIGINDKHEIVGINNSKKLMEDIPNKIGNQLGIICETNLLKKNDLDYIEIIIEPNNVPISYRGKYHYRSGTTKQEINGAALQQFVIKKMGKQWDDIFHESATIDCIDEQAIRYFIKKGIASKRIDESSLGDTSLKVLENLRLLDHGKLKNAAILLFAKVPQKFFTGVQFKIGRFGRNEADLLFQDTIEGNILQMADEVMYYLKGKYLISPIHYEGLQRKEPLEIPEEAFREIIYNSIIHKLYSGSPIQMRVYEERIEIWNEGKLPEDYTIETLFQKHASRPRNHNIADIFYRAGFVEAWGRGIKKICEGFSSAGFEAPTFEENCGGLLVTIKRKNILQDVGSFVGSMSEVQLSERQDKICELIQMNPRISANTMSEVLSVTQRTVERELSHLQHNGIIRHEGNTSAGRWVLLKAGAALPHEK